MQQGQVQNRKRPAPGTSPLKAQNQATFRPLANNSEGLNSSVQRQGLPAPDLQNQKMDWNSLGGLSSVGTFGDASNFDGNLYTNNANGLGTTNDVEGSQSSSQLVRRNANQQLSARGGTNQWQDYGDTGQVTEWNHDTNDDGDLESRALAAKKDAQAKRKQIPPFVQKLSSFLDESKNTDLIRWSDDGNSFIVLDEDEFAKTLIPELFKHNNYASFVRQLNMYGFHKRVGLSDNSMKASENKRKTPSEYYNEFFKRGRPELLWLISKPKNAPSSSKKRKGDRDDGDEEEDRIQDAESAPADSATARRDLITLPKTELDSVRSELRQLQQQQRYISSVIAQVKKQNDQLYQQASAFQTLHDRHENSINAILTFLATFYSRSLEGHGGANIQDMFAHAIPGNLNQHQGNVVDVGDIDDARLHAASQPPRATRRPLALLPAPDTRAGSLASQTGTASPSPMSAANTRIASGFRPTSQTPSSQGRYGSARPSSSSGRSPAPKVEPLTPDTKFSVPEVGANTPNTEQMMQVINAANNSSATPTSPAAFDFPAALADYQTANGATPLTPQQKNDVLSMIARSQPGGAGGNNNNALVNPNGSSLPQLPNMDDFAESQQQLGFLQQLQEDNQRRVNDLAERLVPLSPTGSIPGLNIEGQNTLGPQMGAPGGASQPPEWSLDDFDNTDYFGNNSSTFTGDDLFNFDAAAEGGLGAQPGADADFDLFGDSNAEEQDQNINNSGLTVRDESHGGGRVESVASSDGGGTPKVVSTDFMDASKSPNKRRRVG